jgi:hypothetical protein
VTEAERRRAFARKFILQARSDWDMYELLAGLADVPVCHKLHFLQMACEKLAKSHRLRDTDSPVDELLSRHTGFAKFIPSFCTLGAGRKVSRERCSAGTRDQRLASVGARNREVGSGH